MAKKTNDTGKEAPAKKAPAKKATTATKKTVDAETKTVKKAAEKPAAKTKAAPAAKTETKKSTTKQSMPAQSLPNAVQSYSRFTEFDVSLFRSGKHYKLYEKFGSHVMKVNGVIGTYFSVWAPNAQYVSVIGNFNYWDRGSHPGERLR